VRKIDQFAAFDVISVTAFFAWIADAPYQGTSLDVPKIFPAEIPALAGRHGHSCPPLFGSEYLCHKSHFLYQLIDSRQTQFAAIAPLRSIIC
jgi:hypothetical protein